MKPIYLILTLLLSASLLSVTVPDAGGQEPEVPAVTAPDAPPAAPEDGETGHALFQGDNIIPHEPGRYCGNTVTVLRYTDAEGEKVEKSFWGSPSVALTDLLLYLDYQEGVCRCMPEYEVETEFSDIPYGINLTSAYVRHDGKQVSLTQEQVEQIQEILDNLDTLDTALLE